MPSEIDKLAEVPGILAALQVTAGGTTYKASKENAFHQGEDVLKGCYQVLTIIGTEEIKIAFDKYSVLMIRADSVVFGVIVVKAHPVIKSLKRMLRAAFKGQKKENQTLKTSAGAGFTPDLSC